ncbi:hypothetical protein GCM10028798_19400 [Humibacter antri]
MITVEPTAPGGWLAAVMPGRLAVVHHPEPDAAFAVRLWTALGGDDGIRHVLDELARNGLISVPGFVLAEWEGAGDACNCRFIVRGGAGVVVETATGGEDITANGVSTWVERVVNGVRGFRVECIPAQPAGGPPLPLMEGSAWVSAVSFGSAAESHGAASQPSEKQWPERQQPEKSGNATQIDAIPTPSEATPEPVTSAPVPSAPVPSAPAARGPILSEPAARMDDLDRTIADLEVTVAGEAAAESGSAAQEPAVQQPMAQQPVPSEASAHDGTHETTAYDHLFGATMMRTVEDAAARPETEDVDASPEPASAAIPPLPPAAPATTAAAAPAEARLGDHDGLTVLSGDLKAMRSAAASVPIPGAADASHESDVVRPGAVDDDGFTLRLPDGRTEPIDGMVVVGRAPSVSKMGGGRVPRLVTVDSAEHDISRNHVQLTVEGGTVVVTDLHSRNGTLIALPGKPPQKLRAGEPTSVIAGTVIDLGSGVTLALMQT